MFLFVSMFGVSHCPLLLSTMRSPPTLAFLVARMCLVLLCRKAFVVPARYGRHRPCFPVSHMFTCRHRVPCRHAFLLCLFEYLFARMSIGPDCHAARFLSTALAFMPRMRFCLYRLYRLYSSSFPWCFESCLWFLGDLFGLTEPLLRLCVLLLLSVLEVVTHRQSQPAVT